MAPEYQDQDLQKRQNIEAQIHKAVHTNTGFTNIIEPAFRNTNSRMYKYNKYKFAGAKS